MGMIEDLFNEATSFAESFGYPYSKEQHLLGEKSEELMLRLNKILNDEENKLFEDILELKLKVSGLELDRMFVYGFRMGARLTIDVFKED